MASYFLKIPAILVFLAISVTGNQTPESTTPKEGTTDEDINAKNRKSEILDQVLGYSYDTKIRPLGIHGSGPVKIDVDIQFRSIENVDDSKMEYTVQVVYRQRWLDPRLNYYHIEPNVTDLKLLISSRIWMPDVFFDNEKSGILHKLVVPNIYTRIYTNGTVLQSYRFTILLACPMNLRSYPLDVQICPFRLANFGYTTKDVLLNWRTWNPIQHKKFTMPQFSIVSFTPNICTSHTSTGNYSCIGVDIKMKRAFGYFLIQIYIPCAMLVLVSWVSFWLDPTAVEARVSLGVTSILTIVSQTYGINRTVPPASYIKALDVWTSICQFLVFGGLLEFALVNYITRVTLPQKVIKRFRSLVHMDNIEDAVDEEVEEAPKVKSKKSLERCMERAKRVDRIARIGFPGIFFLFNIAYWTSYGFYSYELH